MVAVPPYFGLVGGGEGDAAVGGSLQGSVGGDKQAAAAAAATAATAAAAAAAAPATTCMARAQAEWFGRSRRAARDRREGFRGLEGIFQGFRVLEGIFQGFRGLEGIFQGFGAVSLGARDDLHKTDASVVRLLKVEVVQYRNGGG